MIFRCSKCRSSYYTESYRVMIAGNTIGYLSYCPYCGTLVYKADTKERD